MCICGRASVFSESLSSPQETAVLQAVQRGRERAPPIGVSGVSTLSTPLVFQHQYFIISPQCILSVLKGHKHPGYYYPIFNVTTSLKWCCECDLLYCFWLGLAVPIRPVINPRGGWPWLKDAVYLSHFGLSGTWFISGGIAACDATVGGYLRRRWNKAGGMSRHD